MNRWEYRTVKAAIGPLYNLECLEEFNLFGEQGWELVQLLPATPDSRGQPIYVGLFKRRRARETPPPGPLPGAGRGRRGEDAG